MKSAMKIATWNVNGIRARASDVEAWLKTEQPDVLCLQEIKATPEQIPPSLCALEGYACYWHGGAKGYSGVGLHVRHGLSAEPPTFFHPPFDHESRIVAAKVAGFTVASVYVPNGGKDLVAKIAFLKALTQWVKEHRSRNEEIVVAGDLNVARTDQDVHPRERRSTAIGQLEEERTLFAWLLDAGLVDVTRSLAPNDDALFTWWAPWRNMRARNIGWRIDYLLASPGLAGRAIASVSQREVGTSDHAPLVTTFSGP